MNVIYRNRNFNLFNYKDYLKSQNIFWSFTITKILSQEPNQALFYKLKNDLTNHLNKYESRSYLKALIMANSSELDLETYQVNGVSHLFSISGLHIHLISLLLLGLMKCITKRTLISYSVVSLFLVFYLFFTNFSISVVRSVLYFIATFINKTFNLYIKPINILILVLAIILFCNPLIIYSAGFQFTFIISAAILTFKKIIDNQTNYFTKSLAISTIAFIASIPILALNYYNINLLSPFLNLIFIPIVSFLILPLVFITPLLPNDNALTIVIELFEQLSLFFNTYRLELILAKPSVILIVIYVIIIYYTLRKIAYRKYHYISLIIIIICYNHYIAFFNAPALHMIDVGQGDSFLLTTKYENILIDTGGSLSYDVAKKIVIPYLKSVGVLQIDYLILTHGDYDHIGDAINLVNNFHVKNVVLNCGTYNELENKLINELTKKNIKYYSCIKEINIDNDKLNFLKTKEYGNENDNSNVIYTEINNYKFLFMGDAGKEVEKDILNKYNLDDVDVLKVGHHGSNTSSSEEFVGSINPKYSIISVGKNNRYDHPSKEVLTNLKDSKIYRTDKDGGTIFKIKNNELKVETCQP